MQHLAEISKGAILVTRFIKPDEAFKSEYGQVTGATWLREEAMRLRRAGIETQIIPEDKKGSDLVALIRKNNNES